MDVVVLNHAETLMVGSISVKSNNTLQSNLDPEETWETEWGEISEAE